MSKFVISSNIYDSTTSDSAVCIHFVVNNLLPRTCVQKFNRFLIRCLQSLNLRVNIKTSFSRKECGFETEERKKGYMIRAR